MFRTISLALLSGLLLSLAWPTNGFPFLLFFAFVPLLLMEQEIHKRQSVFLLSLFAFLVWNTLTTFWIVNATWIGVIMAVLINSLLMASAFTLFSWVKSRLGQKRGWWAFICVWLSFEYLHFNWDLSWPWLALGNGFSSSPALVQWYEYTGVLGGSLWVLTANVLAFNSWHSKRFISLALWILLPIGLSFLVEPSLKEIDKVNVVVVQPNIDPYSEKFDGMGPEKQLEKFLLLASKKVDSTTDFLIGPETALTGGLWENNLDQSPLINQLKNYLINYPQLKIIVGASTYRMYDKEEVLTETARYHQRAEGYYDAYNTALQIDTSGIQIYHKSKLVPGVETMPFAPLLQHIKSLSIDLGGISGSLGSQKERSVFYSKQATVAPIICYESIYGEYVLEYIRRGADVLTIITNDGWWKDTPGYRQHLAYASLRAIETRRVIARSANTGISGFIDAKGNISKATEWWQSAVISAELPTYQGITFYTLYGNYIGRLAAFVFVILFFYSLAKREVRD